MRPPPGARSDEAATGSATESAARRAHGDSARSTVIVHGSSLERIADPSLVPLHFALSVQPSRAQRARYAIGQLLRHPMRAASILSAWLTGKRLRARQALAALIGITHRLTLPADRAPEPDDVGDLPALGIDLVRPDTLAEGTPGASPLIVLTPPDHVLLAEAGKSIASAFRGAPALQVLYGDALFQRVEGGPLLPLLRPAFDRDFLLQADYLGPVLALRRSSLAALGGKPVADAFDLVLRIADHFGAGAIGHLPRILSLWRSWQSTESPMAIAGDKRLDNVRHNLERNGESDAAASRGSDGLIRIARPLPEPRPLVSLIVPTRDRLDLLQPCLTSLLRMTDWPEKEILVCDNDSRKPATLTYFSEITARGEARILSCPGLFDFAAMNNEAAETARGRVLVFVNNDVEAFQPDWLELMVREALRPDVGAVGAKLLDGEGRIQHGGIVLGTGGGLVTHGHRHFPGDAPGYLGELMATHRVSAVTAACLAVEARKFRSIGGFDAEHFSVDFNDVDLCLRLNAAGYRTLLVPSAILHHREAASRVRSQTAEERHRREVASLKKRWGPLLAQDPHYHPGFDPNLSTHARLRRGWTGRESARPR